MALPSSGPLTLSQIQTEFGGSNPISLSEYYAGGSYVPAGTSGTYGAVPSSGAISIRNFYGTTAVVYGKGPNGYNFPVNSWYTVATGLNTGSGFPRIGSSGTTVSIFTGNNATGTSAPRTGYVTCDSNTSSVVYSTGLLNQATSQGTTANTPVLCDKNGNTWNSYTETDSAAVSNNSGLGVLRYTPNGTSASLFMHIYHTWSSNQSKNQVWTPITASNGQTASCQYIGSQICRFDYTTGLLSSAIQPVYNYNLAFPNNYYGSMFMKGYDSSSRRISYQAKNTSYPQLFVAWDENINYLQEWTFADSGSGSASTFQASSFFYYTGLTPNNIGFFTGSGRYGGTTSTYNRGWLAWFNFSTNPPTLIKATRANTTSEFIGGLGNPYYLSSSNGKDYWGFETGSSGYFNTVILETNSSGIVTQGWTSNTILALLRTGHGKSIEEFQITPLSNAYCGFTTVAKLVAGSVYGVTLTPNNTYNGSAIWNVAAFSIANTTMAFTSTTSYPPNAYCFEHAYNPCTTSSPSTYSVTPTDMVKLPLVQG
jgi:hypothetical protein